MKGSAPRKSLSLDFYHVHKASQKHHLGIKSFKQEHVREKLISFFSEFGPFPRSLVMSSVLEATRTPLRSLSVKCATSGETMPGRRDHPQGRSQRSGRCAWAVLSKLGLGATPAAGACAGTGSMG